MTPEMQLQNFIDRINHTVQQLKQSREQLSARKAAINSQLRESLVGAVAKTKEKISNAIAEGETQIAALQPKGDTLREETSALKSKLQNFIDQFSGINTALVLSEDARNNIAIMHAKPAELVGKLEDFKEQLAQVCQEFNNVILERLDDFEDYVIVFQNQSERIQEAVDSIETEVFTHLEKIQEHLAQANSFYEATVTADFDDLVKQAFDQLLYKIEQELSKGTKNVNSTIAKLNESGLNILTDITSVIGKVNETLEDAIKITEPVKPVLDVASSMA